MSESEDQLQKEWRDIIIKKLDSLDSDIKSIQTDVRDAVLLAKDVETVKTSVGTLEKELAKERVTNVELKASVMKEVKENYTSKDQFGPIQKLVWGAATTVLLAVLGGALTLLLK